MVIPCQDRRSVYRPIYLSISTIRVACAILLGMRPKQDRSGRRVSQPSVPGQDTQKCRSGICACSSISVHLFTRQIRSWFCRVLVYKYFTCSNSSVFKEHATTMLDTPINYLQATLRWRVSKIVAFRVHEIHHYRVIARTANLRTKILDFRGFDPSIISVLRGGILMFILAGIILVGRLRIPSDETTASAPARSSSAWVFSSSTARRFCRSGERLSGCKASGLQGFGASGLGLSLAYARAES